MTLIAKCPPFPLCEEGERILELPVYKDAAPQPGDTLYLWFSETAGGAGLAGRAQIAAIRPGKPLTVAMVVDTATCATPFGKADLAGWRDVKGADPRATLADKLYRHSLNKIAALAPAEAELLEACLTGAPIPAGPQAFGHEPYRHPDHRPGGLARAPRQARPALGHGEIRPITG